jgi:hypothetical protein
MLRLEEAVRTQISKALLPQLAGNRQVWFFFGWSSSVWFLTHCGV